MFNREREGKGRREGVQERVGYGGRGEGSGREGEKDCLEGDLMGDRIVLDVIMLYL